MNNLKQIIALLVLSAFVACTEKVDIKLDSGAPLVVVEGYIATEVDSSYVRLSLSKDYFASRDIIAIEDAVVEVSSVNGTTLFQYKGDGYYRPSPGFKPDTAVMYNLKVIANGKEYTSSSMLYPMFYVLPEIFFEYSNDTSGFLTPGYKVRYVSNDSRPDEIFTLFNFGQNDTLFEQEIIFSNAGLRKNELLPFELPFYRPQLGDSVMLEFRSLDVKVANYRIALGNLQSGAPGPFRTPPANPPTNISGGAVGYFMATDVFRIGQVIR